MNTAFQVPAADNDPCWHGMAEATIVTGPSTETCAHAVQSHYMQPVRWQAHSPPQLATMHWHWCWYWHCNSIVGMHCTSNAHAYCCRLLLLFINQVSLSATDPSGNTITGTGYIAVVDSTPPYITNDIFQPAASQRRELQSLGQVTFGCNNRGVLGCGKRDPAMRRAGVAIKVLDPTAWKSHLKKALTITATDNHPCFSPSLTVSLETFANVNAGQVSAMLETIGASEDKKDEAASVARNAAGFCTIRQWTVKDPAGNIDRAAELACARIRRSAPGKRGG